MKNFLAVAIWNDDDGSFSISREIRDIDSDDREAIISFMGKEASFSEEDNRDYLYDILLIKNGDDGLPLIFQTIPLNG